MRLSHYGGELAIWSVAQIADAATRWPSFQPTQEGIEMLQQAWDRAGRPELSRTVQKGSNMHWAKTAMNDVLARIPRYEEVPA